MNWDTPKFLPDHIKIKKDKTLGYLYFMDKTHPLSDRIGKVYLHRHEASVKIGRWVTKGKYGEKVHHEDSNRSNNTSLNLEVCGSQSEHLHKHYPPIIKHCLKCGVKFQSNGNSSTGGDKKFYCSPRCSYLGRRKFEISKEELQKLVWEYPTVEVAKMLNVSDKAIEKRCKILEINKPPRGYWEKKRAGK